MSSNDFISLLKVKDYYEIVHADSDTGHKYSKVIAKTPLQALQKAQEMQEEVAPEYGIVIDVLKDK